MAALSLIFLITFSSLSLPFTVCAWVHVPECEGAHRSQQVSLGLDRQAVVRVHAENRT